MAQLSNLFLKHEKKEFSFSILNFTNWRKNFIYQIFIHKYIYNLKD